jgi:mxaD protein
LRFTATAGGARVTARRREKNLSQSHSPEEKKMRKVGLALLGLLMLVPCAARADDRELLVVAEMIEINAKPAEVWNFLKRFNGLKDWHPAFAKSDIIKGSDGKVGAVRALTVKDGPTFTEELLAFNDKGMAFTYNIIESPLPLDHYLSTMSVKPNGSGGSTVTWIGTFVRKNPRDNLPEAESDAGALGFITGAYAGGLQNLKKIMESK